MIPLSGITPITPKNFTIKKKEQKEKNNEGNQEKKKQRQMCVDFLFVVFLKKSNKNV